MPWITSGSATASPTCIRGSSAAIGSWNTICMSPARFPCAPARSATKAACPRSRSARHAARAPPAPWRSSTCRSRFRRPGAKVSPGRMSKLTRSDGVNAVGRAAEEVARRRRSGPRCPRGVRPEPAPRGAGVLRARPPPRDAALRPAARGCRRRAVRRRSAPLVASSTIRPCLHHDDPVGHLGHHAHVVGDQDDRRCPVSLAGRAAGPAPRAGRSRPAPSSARPRSAPPGAAPAPSRSSRAGACRPTARAGIAASGARARRGAPARSASMAATLRLGPADRLMRADRLGQLGADGHAPG